jgi:hypothetical protein
MVFVDGSSEARPAGAALELRAGLAQRQTAQAAGEHALAFLGEEDAAERFLVAVVEYDTALFVVEAVDQLPELRVGGPREIVAGLRRRLSSAIRKTHQNDGVALTVVRSRPWQRWSGGWRRSVQPNARN